MNLFEKNFTIIFFFIYLFNHIYTDNNLRVQAQNTIVQINIYLKKRIIKNINK